MKVAMNSICLPLLMVGKCEFWDQEEILGPWCHITDLLSGVTLGKFVFVVISRIAG